MKFIKTIISKKKVLILILILAAFLRFYQIDRSPPSLTWDEVSNGYDAYSILKTGKDQWGESFPLAFKSFGEYKYPLHIYATSVSIAIFGLNEFGARFPAAFFGILNILILYFVVIKLTKNNFIAISSSFLLAISPWHIQFSRINWETNFSLLFFLLGLYSFLDFAGIKDIFKKKLFFLSISFLLFGIGIFTYNAAKVFIILFIPVLIFLYRKELLKQKFATFLGVLIFGLILSINLFDSRLSGINRFKQLDFEQAEVSSTTTYKITKIYSLGKIELFSRQYLLHFSPKFLFISGDPNLRHSTQIVGQFYWFELLLFGFGLLYFIKTKSKWGLLILGWLILAPLPGSIAKEAPHASRAMFMMGSWHIIAASGLYLLYFSLEKYRMTVIGVFIVVSVYFLGNYFTYYLTDYRIKSSENWKYGYKEVVNYATKYYDDFDLIVITREYGEPQIFTLFYSVFDPYKYQNDPNLARVKDGNWIKVEKFDKYYFPDMEEEGTRFNVILSQNPNKKILFIGKPGDITENLPRAYTVRFLNGETAFEIVEIK